MPEATPETELSPEERLARFRQLSRAEAEELFLSLSSADQAELLGSLPETERRSWVRLLPLDDTADLIQAMPEDRREPALELLDPQTRAEVRGLLAYAEDDAGGIMNPRFARLRPDMTADEATTYLKAQARSRAETIYYAYVMDSDGKLLGVLSFRDLFAAKGVQRVRDIMRTDVVVVPEEMDQEEVSRLFADNDLMAIPVVDAFGRMKGIVTVDDVVNVVEEEATEDIQKIGGTGVLGEPYLKLPFFQMIQKRAGWLTVLFLGEMLTASAMAHFEMEIERAVVLALFIPLIISSGGNCGSQASTLVIRALALGEVRLRDWWRVFLRELAAGAVLGLILGAIGLARIALWPGRETVYGEHYLLLGYTVFASLVGVVLWGTLSGSMLPLFLKRLGFDPATASAPFVATLVDVTGLVIYFTAASLFLSGTLL